MTSSRWLRALIAALSLVVLGSGLLAGCRTPGSPTATPTGSTSTSASVTPRAQGTAGERRSSTDPETGLVWIDESALPVEAQKTLTLIDAGGPFPYSRDGVVFRNDEGILPDQPRGYYHEYTVKTPGESDRGPRRIVTGGVDAEFFWTDDHYDTFSRIRR